MTMHTRSRGLLAVTGMAATLCLSGCFATTREYTDLRGDMVSLKTVISQMQANQADLALTMEELNGSMIALGERLAGSRGQMSGLAVKLDDLESNLTFRMDTLSTQLSGAPQQQQPRLSEVYAIAYSDYSQGRYKLAAVGFRNYLDRYPHGELAPKALFYFAETVSRSGSRDEAVSLYERYIRLYPMGEFVESARGAVVALRAAPVIEEPVAVTPSTGTASGAPASAAGGAPRENTPVDR